MEPQQARLAFAGFLTLCALIVFNALFLQKDAGFVGRGESDRGGSRGFADKSASRSGEQQGTKGAELLRAIMRELSAQNYFPGRATSHLAHRVDAMTMGAIMAYQYDNNLPITGKPTDELLKNILFGGASTARNIETSEPAPALQLIAEIQGTLAGLELYDGKIDGLLREASGQAVRRFERQRGLPVTGRISGVLVQELMRATGVEFSPLR